MEIARVRYARKVVDNTDGEVFNKDVLMTRKWICSLLSASVLAFAGTSQAAVHSPTTAASPDSAGISLIYDPASGDLTIQPPEGIQLTAIELRSANGSFTGDCDGLDSPFDVCTSTKIFKLDVDGFSKTSLGNVLRSGMKADQLAADLTVDGATLPSGFNVGSGVFITTVPEPATCSLLAVPTLLLWSRLRRKSR